MVAVVLFGATAASATSLLQRHGVVKEAEIVSMQGEGWVLLVKEKNWIEALREQGLTGGDSVKTGSYGKMGILFSEGTQIKVNRKSTLLIKSSAAEGAKGTVLGLEAGEVWSRARAVPGGLRIETPSATAAIRGTEWNVLVDESGTSYVTVIRGIIEFYNDFGTVTVNPGEQASAAVGSPPVKTVLVRPRDRVQWVISYVLSMPDLVRFQSLRRREALGRLSSSQERWRKDPADRADTLSLAELLFDLHRRQESLKHVEEVLSAEPSNLRALLLRGYLALDSYKPDEARKFFERVLASGDENGRQKALIGLIGASLAMNEVGKASRLLADLESEDRSPQVGLVSASMEAYSGDFRKGLATCADYAEKNPGDERFRILAAGLSLLLDEREKAREYLAEAIAMNPESSEAYATLGACDYIEGRGKEAEKAYRKSLALDPDNFGARNGLGVLLMERGYYAEAGREFSRSLEIAPRGPMTWANRGFLYTMIEDLQGARKDFESSLEIDPTNYSTRNVQGLVALKEGKNQEAVRNFLEASLLEPRFSLSHSFLAIAFYQQGDIVRALEETRLAEALDPRDPFPHLIAYLIHQDTYRPSDAVKEAKSVLDRIPYLKSIDEVANTRSGISNLGSALSGFGLTDWAEGYAQESYDPHIPGSHFFAARQYNNNLQVSIGERLQGLLLDPLSLSSPARYQDILRRPRNDLALSSTLGEVKGAFSQSYQAVAQGYTRNPFETSYFLSAQGSRSDGFIENGDSRGYSINAGIGSKPDYKNGFYLSGYYTRNKSGYFGSLKNPDPDDRFDTTFSNAEAGYHHRFGPKNHLIARVAAGRSDFTLTNPAPLGTGLTDTQLSFITAGWTPDETRAFFRQGVYDLSAIAGPPAITLATDSTGVFGSTPSVPRLPSAFPAVVDLDPTALERTTSDTLGFQLRHLFQTAETHEMTYGLEFVPFRNRLRTTANQFVPTGTIDFYEEFFLPTGSVWSFPLVSAGPVSTDRVNSGNFLLAYLDDRWKPKPDILIEGGAFLFGHHDDNNDTSCIYPKVGVAVKVLRNHILRVGYQKWMEQPSLGTLAPLTNAGLVINNSLAIDASRLTDYQVRLESRWTERLFTAVGAERIGLKDPAPGEGYLWRALRADSLNAAFNAIVSEEIGFFLRYRYMKGKGTDGPLRDKEVPDLPTHVTSGGLVWVSPKYVKATLATSYAAGTYQDYTNTGREPSYWMTNFAVTWEPFRKHLLLALALNNLFDNGSPAPPRSSSATLEYRF